MNRRLLITLLLLLAIPLRSFAAMAMPCRPADRASAMSAMPDHAASMHHDDRSPTSEHDDATQADVVVHAAVPACCALAMIASPALVVAPTPGGLPSAAAPRSDPVAAFLTDAPERPPRFPILSA